MKAPYKSSRYRPRRHDNQVFVEHYYRVDIFITTTLDKQLHELNNRFNDHAMELLTLGSSLVFKKSSKVLDIDKICYLVKKKYYLIDFTEQERMHLGYQLDLFSINVPKNLLSSADSTLAELCRCLVETEKCEEFHFVDRLIRLILTHPVSTATTERAFSAMKICKNRLRNKMSDYFLASNLVVYIEKEIADKFNSEFISDEFKKLKGRKAKLL
uniref:uncharacterized protein LOC122587845 n=1 Tax=Erigeron canadensis TaxID=72917 RepID=UPI001CB9A747|nr:uncharacterized protein LOC122587845 [Erigeron canadensis]